MTTDSDGVLHRSTVAGCANYNPVESKPTGVRAHDVPGRVIHECLNCKPTKKGREIRHTCGDEYCVKYEANGR